VLNVQVPVGSTCEVTLPDGKTAIVQSGAHVFTAGV